jgi:superfamily II DNA or RNA helicase
MTLPGEEDDRVFPITVYRAEANLMRVSKLPDGFLDEAERKYSFSFYDEKACKRCPLLEQRHSEACDSCEKFLGHRQLSKVVTKGKNQYLSVPIGGTKRLDNLLKGFNLQPTFVDKFYGLPTHRAIKVTRELREWQNEALGVCLERKHGIVESPPRSGKTILGVALTAKVWGKTFIIASQRDWLSQFYDSFVGTDTEEAFSNINPKRIGFCKVYEDFVKNDVCLMTFQQFMNKSGRALLKRIGDMAKLVLIDEVHGSSALETSRVLSRFSAEYMIGLTGTPNRKFTDEEIVFRLLVGPILYRSKVDMLVPKVRLLRTGVTINLPGGPQARNRGHFARFITNLETHKGRVAVVARYVARAIKAGHTVMLPVNRMKSVKIYVDAINEYFPENVCCTFTGALHKDQRKKNLADIRSGAVQAIVGNIALLSTGLNIPRLTMLIDRITITSNLPKAIQRISRILTPMEGKREPVLVIILDDCNMQRATTRNEFFNAIKGRFNPKISPEDLAELNAWFKDTKSLGSQPKRGKGKNKAGSVLMNTRSL